VASVQLCPSRGVTTTGQRSCSDQCWLPPAFIPQCPSANTETIYTLQASVWDNPTAGEAQAQVTCPCRWGYRGWAGLIPKPGLFRLLFLRRLPGVLSGSHLIPSACSCSPVFPSQARQPCLGFPSNSSIVLGPLSLGLWSLAPPLCPTGKKAP
jgi:hypothetical protein